MPGHRLVWAIVGLILVLIGLNSGAQSFLGGEKEHDQLVFRNRGVSASDSELKWSQMVLSKLPSLVKQRMLLQPNLQKKETGGM